MSSTRYSLNAIGIVGAVGNDRSFFWQRNGAVLQAAVSLPEQVFTVVFQSFVSGGHQDDRHHRQQQSGDRFDPPLVEKDDFFVTEVELELNMDLLM